MFNRAHYPPTLPDSQTIAFNSHWMCVWRLQFADPLCCMQDKRSYFAVCLDRSAPFSSFFSEGIWLFVPSPDLPPSTSVYLRPSSEAWGGCHRSPARSIQSVIASFEARNGTYTSAERLPDGRDQSAEKDWSALIVSSPMTDVPFILLHLLQMGAIGRQDGSVPLSRQRRQSGRKERKANAKSRQK